jgi:cellulose synthase/poly-beta-1,6-N-acetylglucosamine synthase-like glycosyltransferase
MIYIAFIVLILSFLNLLRMGVFLIGSDVYDIKKNFSKRKSSELDAKNSRKRAYSPLMTVLVPAHNEEVTLRRNLDSIYNSTYKNIELIIINDSSTDRTYNIARNFQRQYKQRFKRLKVLNVQLRGKAPALNAGLQYAKGSLFMCLDADSALAPTAIEEAVREFRDPTLACMSSNVKIFPAKGMLNFFQRVEYLVCYQMKKTETVTDIQYIVGGIGSTFRTRLVRKLGWYDTDTITEDIDLSMKILSTYTGKYRIGYSPNVVAFTESVYDIPGLLRQRFRWKYGRYQAFFKYKHLFWSRARQSNKILGWVYLPFALLSEFLYLLEPLLLLLVAYLLFTYGDATIIASSFLVFLFYTTIHITGATSGYTPRERVAFIAAAPLAYIGMYVLSAVEYCATINGFINLPKIYANNKSGKGVSHWTHVERKGNAAIS